MANITDQFVTSFSELYIGDQLQTGKSFTLVDSDGTKVRGFFEPSATVHALGDSLTQSGTKLFQLQILTLTL